jgi:hypothetical protein
MSVYYNNDGAVGTAPAANHREDVLLVQFAFAAMAANPLPDTSMELFRAMCDVKPTGTIDQATINAIRAMQIELKRSQPSTKVDGRVCPADGDHVEGAFTIEYLSEAVQQCHIRLWPRIDKIPGCPLELKEMVGRAVQGTE